MLPRPDYGKAGSGSKRRENASTEASLPGGHCCCHARSGISARGSNPLASRPYSSGRHDAAGRRLGRTPRAWRSVIGNLRWRAAADTDPVHEAVRPRANGRTPERRSERLVDGAAVLARQPGPAGGAAGRPPEADDAEVVLSGDIAALPLLRGILVRARLPPHGQVRVDRSSLQGPRNPPQGMCTRQLGDALA